MKIRFNRLFYFAFLSIGWYLTVGTVTVAQESHQSRGDWLTHKDEHTGTITSIMEMTLTPAGEPRPALKYRLLLDEFNRREGNAALFYLKAMGFLEQNNSRNQLEDMYKKARESARQDGKSIYDYPPQMYLYMHPDEYPIHAVKHYLELHSFQEFLLTEASKCKSFVIDRNIREVESPVSYWIPEIQVMRELARVQSVRSRLAIAEGRIDDAIRIVGQQMAMSNHLGQDEFFISNLVGLACGGIGLTDLAFLLQHANTPNLYWALATLPTPQVDMMNSLSLERKLLFMELKVLNEVDQYPKPAAYWSQRIDESMPAIRNLLILHDSQEDLSKDEVEAKWQVGLILAAAYPSAREYLLTRAGMSQDDLAKLCVTQTVLLGYRRCYEELGDEILKRWALPVFQSFKIPSLEPSLESFDGQVGSVSALAQSILPAADAARHAQTGQQQLIGLLQTVESIRQYGFKHGGQLPPTLSVLELPSPFDPKTNQPFEYSLNGDKAILSSQDDNHFRHRLIIKFRK